MTKLKGTLYLVPVLLGETLTTDVLPFKTIEIAKSLQHFIVENAKSARRFLKMLPSNFPLQEINVMELDKHSSNTDFDYFFEPLRNGFDTGLVSEAGMPAIADPGSIFVLQAHKENIKVVPLAGPSSIFLALAASGLNGQGFMFHGYLPKNKQERIEKIKALESAAMKNKITQIFIETPYRNQPLLEDILTVAHSSLLLCIASGISTSSEVIITKTISEWKRKIPNVKDVPTVFLIL